MFLTTYFKECSFRYDDLLQSDQRNKYNRRCSNHPTEYIRPCWELIDLIGSRNNQWTVSIQSHAQNELYTKSDKQKLRPCRTNNFKKKTFFYRDARGSDILPAVAPKWTWIIVDHFLDILANPVRTIDPSDGYVLDQHGDHDRVDGRVVVEELDNIVAALSATRQANEEVEREQAADEELATLAKDRVLICQCSDDRLTATELLPHTQGFNCKVFKMYSGCYCLPSCPGLR